MSKDTKDKATQTDKKEVSPLPKVKQILQKERSEEDGGWLLRVYGGSQPKETPSHAEEIRKAMEESENAIQPVSQK